MATTVYQCLHCMAPAYLSELCLPITASASRRSGLWSATASNLVIPRCRLSTYSTRAFSVASPVCWNSLPDYLKSSDLSFNCFRQQLITFLFCKYWHQSQHYFCALETLSMRSSDVNIDFSLIQILNFEIQFRYRFIPASRCAEPWVSFNRFVTACCRWC